MKIMNKKFTPQIELEAAAYPHASADLIIRNEFDKYLDIKREASDKKRKFLFYLILFFIFAIPATYFYPRVYNYVQDSFTYMKSSKIENTLGIYGYEIKASALNTHQIDVYSMYNFKEDTTIHQFASYAKLIHIYNSDYYGKNLNLSEISERRLWSFMNYLGFNNEDLCGLDRAFSGDVSMTIREWLFSINSNQNHNNSYFNPKVVELQELKQLYETQLDNELRKPFSKYQINTLRRYSVHRNISSGNSQKVILGVLNYAKNDPALFEKLFYLKDEIRRINNEIDIRLALSSMSMASDFGYRGNYQLFAWLKADKNGADLIKKKKNSKNSLYVTIANDYSIFSGNYKQSRDIFKKMNLDYYDYVIENPIRIGLQVKDVGLFGVRRRSDNGFLYEHKGIDLMADRGTAVFPVREGYIINVEEDTDGHGNYVVIWHDNSLTSSYSHMQPDEYFKELFNNYEKNGPIWVGLHSRIGSVGTSGNIPKGDPQYGYAHLHLEIKESNKYKNPFLMLQEKIKVIH
ncbi:MAG: M23 family metallopeptidase [Candidatus Marinimicrobia bacterium]|nr:M23 family metallopeptidase [Candidatus Neomarinimicrobiota bacterium]